MRIRSAAFVIKDGQILLLERWKNGLHYFAVPGGTVEDDENLEDAVKRELLEEASIEIEVDKVVLEDFTAGYGKCVYFSLKSFAGTPKISKESPEAGYDNPDNHYELKWVDFDNLANINLLPKSAKDYLNNSAE